MRSGGPAGYRYEERSTPGPRRYTDEILRVLLMSSSGFTSRTRKSALLFASIVPVSLSFRNHHAARRRLCRGRHRDDASDYDQKPPSQSSHRLLRCALYQHQRQSLLRRSGWRTTRDSRSRHIGTSSPASAPGPRASRLKRTGAGSVPPRPISPAGAEDHLPVRA